MLLPPPEHAESDAVPPHAAKRFWPGNASCSQAHKTIDASAAPIRTAIAQQSMPAAHQLPAPSSQASVHTSAIPRDKYGPVLAQYRPATLQAWAALTMSSGDAAEFVRRETISDSFSCIGEYQWQLACALSEELQLRCATPCMAASHATYSCCSGRASEHVVDVDWPQFAPSDAGAIRKIANIFCCVCCAEPAAIATCTQAGRGRISCPQHKTAALPGGRRAEQGAGGASEDLQHSLHLGLGW